MTDSNQEKREKLIEINLRRILNGDFNLKLNEAKILSEEAPSDYRISIILAYSLLANQFALQAAKELEKASEISDGDPEVSLFRSLFFSYIGQYSRSEEELILYTRSLQSLPGVAHHMWAKVKASRGEFTSAFKEMEKSLELREILKPEDKKVLELFKEAAGLDKKFQQCLSNNDPESNKYVLNELIFSCECREYWFAIWLANQILADMSKTAMHKEILTILIRTYIKAQQTHQAITFLDIYRERFGEDESAIIYNDEIDSLIVKQIALDPFAFKNEKKTNSYITGETERETEEELALVTNPLSLFSLFSVNLYNFVDELSSGQKTYFKEFNTRETNFIGADLAVKNPFYKTKSQNITGSVRWYNNHDFYKESVFEVQVEKEWEYFLFSQSFGSEHKGFWKKGTGRLEIYLANELIGKRTFILGDENIKEDLETEKPNLPTGSASASDTSTQEEELTKSLDELLAELNSFIGLNSVKQSMRDFVDYLQFQMERKKSGLKSESVISLHTLYLGNPGTGKTTVARLMGKIFHAMGLLEKGHLVEVDRSALVSQYIGETAQKTDKVIEEAMGGVLFIDEAYTLFKQGNAQDFGKEAIDTLLKRMEDKAGHFAVIAAGYPEDMEVFLSANSGMKSRINFTFNFEDYTPDELIEIIKRFADKEEFCLAEDAIAMIKKHITLMYRGRDKTFGNARLMRNIFTDAKMHLGKRYLQLPQEEKTKEALSLISVEDVAPIFWETVVKKAKLEVDEERVQSLIEKIDGLVGLTNVKDEIHSLVKLAKYYYEQGENLNEKFSDHIVFTGNPGTGKTTVARLVSQIYSALTILPKGHLVEADRQKLVASHIGGTSEKTNQLIDSAMGGTLFIDEAYTLVKGGDASGSDFGTEAIDTLLKRMEDDRGKFIVISAGYTDNMSDFLKSNPGLTSRFTKFFNFEDYTPDELMLLTKNMLTGKSLSLSPEAEEMLAKHYNNLFRARDKNFGNARLVRSIVDGIQKRQLLRLVDSHAEERDIESYKTINSEDIRPLVSTLKSETKSKSYKIRGDDEMLQKYMDELNHLTGLFSVKSSVKKLIQGLKVTRLREDRGLKVIQKSLNSVFFGNPGTGKTTVARLISNIYREMGIIEKGHIVEVDRSALVATHIGETAKKTDEVIHSALGGTLFIDEAYTLYRGGNDFGLEAIDTLIKRMEDFRDQLVVIVAGYTNEMKVFLEANPGLKSRFPHYFSFEDYTPRQMLEIVYLMSDRNGYILDEGALQLLLEIFKNAYEQRDKNFGNARTVKNILMKAISNQEDRILTIENPTDEDLITIKFEDVEAVDLSSDL